jgi:probable HAF family extracellular repeat protein
MIRSVLMIAASALLPGAAEAAVRYTITDLGQFFRASDLNDAGWVVGTQVSRAYVRTADGTMIDLGSLRGTTSIGHGINDLNTATGTSAVPGPLGDRHAFTWTQAGGMVDIGEPAGGRVRADGYAINNAGQVVGAGGSSGSGAFLWTQAGGYQLLDALPGGSSALAADINEAGQITGFSSSPAGTRAVRWAPNGQVTDLGALAGGDGTSIAAGINEAGQIIGQSSSSAGERAFLWTEAGGMRDLGALPHAAIRSSAEGINDAGMIVGSSQGDFAYGRAFLWTAEFGMRDLHSLTDTGGKWYLFGASDINNKGQILAAGLLNGQGRAILLTPYEFPGVPEPATWAMMIGGFGLIGSTARRQRLSAA